jgi:hypothetical protein
VLLDAHVPARCQGYIFEYCHLKLNLKNVKKLKLVFVHPVKTLFRRTINWLDPSVGDVQQLVFPEPSLVQGPMLYSRQQLVLSVSSCCSTTRAAETWCCYGKRSLLTWAMPPHRQGHGCPTSLHPCLSMGEDMWLGCFCLVQFGGCRGTPKGPPCCPSPQQVQQC